MKHLLHAALLGAALGLTGRVFSLSPPLFVSTLLTAAVIGQTIAVFRAPPDRIRQAGAVALVIVIATVASALAVYGLFPSS